MEEGIKLSSRDENFSISNYCSVCVFVPIVACTRHCHLQEAGNDVGETELVTNHIGELFFLLLATPNS